MLLQIRKSLWAQWGHTLHFEINWPFIQVDSLYIHKSYSSWYIYCTLWTIKNTGLKSYQQLRSADQFWPKRAKFSSVSPMHWWSICIFQIIENSWSMKRNMAPLWSSTSLQLIWALMISDDVPFSFLITFLLGLFPHIILYTLWCHIFTF